VGGLGIRDGTVLWLGEKKCCEKQEARSHKHRQPGPRNNSTGDGENEVWADEEAFSQAKTRSHLKGQIFELYVYFPCYPNLWVNNT
jgi:hypothetical protein